MLTLAALTFCLAGDPPPNVPTSPPPEALATMLEVSFGPKTPPEAARMLAAILRGSQMGPGEGWFGPAETRYTWKWLAAAHSLPATTPGVSKKDFRGAPELFAVLDRNRDGTIQPDDLNWADDNPYMQMSSFLSRFYRRLDRQGTGKLTRAQWQEIFDRASGGKDTMTADEFKQSLLTGYGSGGFMPGDGPDKAMLIRGLFANEIGSLQEGPHVGQTAPNFVLKTADGDKIELAKLVGPKPVVLVLGNFTCGPFRAYYPGVEEVYQRHKDKANFLMVYVREAHPTDGWKMESNARQGVAVKQPTTYDERVGVAGQFCTKLKPIIPVAVDEISDPVGHAYSGMPARLYVIDPQGKVAYKSGRGPFGFKAAEMEQALALCLLEQATTKR